MSRKVLLLLTILYVVQVYSGSKQEQKQSQVHRNANPNNWLFYNKRFVRDDKLGSEEEEEGATDSPDDDSEDEDDDQVDDGICPVNLFIFILFAVMMIASCVVVIFKIIYIYFCDKEPLRRSGLKDETSRSVNISFWTSSSIGSNPKMSRKEIKKGKLGDLPPPLVFDKPGKISKNAKKFIEGCMRDSAKRTFSQPFSRQDKIDRGTLDLNKKKQKGKKTEEEKVEDQVKKLLVQALIDTSNDCQKRRLCCSILQMLERTGQTEMNGDTPAEEGVLPTYTVLPATVQAQEVKALDMILDSTKRDEVTGKVDVDELIKLFVEKLHDQAPDQTKQKDLPGAPGPDGDRQDQQHLIQGIIKIFAANLKEEAEAGGNAGAQANKSEGEKRREMKTLVSKMDARGAKAQPSQRLIPPRGFCSTNDPNRWSTELVESLKGSLNKSLKRQKCAVLRSPNKSKTGVKAQKSVKGVVSVLCLEMEAALARWDTTLGGGLPPTAALKLLFGEMRTDVRRWQAALRRLDPARQDQPHRPQAELDKK